MTHPTGAGSGSVHTAFLQLQGISINDDVAIYLISPFTEATWVFREDETHRGQVDQLTGAIQEGYLAATGQKLDLEEVDLGTLIASVDYMEELIQDRYNDDEIATVTTICTAWIIGDGNAVMAKLHEWWEQDGDGYTDAGDDGQLVATTG